MASQHPTESRYIVCQQGQGGLWRLVREPPLPDEEQSLSCALDAGQETGRKAHPLLAGRALVHQEHWPHAEAVVRTAAAMSDKRAPAIFKAALNRDGARVGVPIRCNVTGP